MEMRVRSNTDGSCSSSAEMRCSLGRFPFVLLTYPISPVRDCYSLLSILDANYISQDESLNRGLKRLSSERLQI